MNVRPVHDDTSLAWALQEIEEYFGQEPVRGTPESERFDVLATLIEAYEAKRYPIGVPDPIDAVNIRMADKNISRRQLCKATGIGESNLSEVLNRKRALSIGMVRSIGPILELPAELLVQPYALVGRVVA